MNRVGTHHELEFAWLYDPVHVSVRMTKAKPPDIPTRKEIICRGLTTAAFTSNGPDGDDRYGAEIKYRNIVN